MEILKGVGDPDLYWRDVKSGVSWKLVTAKRERLQKVLDLLEPVRWGGGHYTLWEMTREEFDAIVGEG